MIKAFGSDISGIKAFGSDVTKVMAYGEEVWSKQTSIPDYLCFTALESGTFTLTVPAAVTSTNLSYVEYSLDGRNWNRTDILAQDQTIQVGTEQNPIPVGGKVYWRGSGSRMSQASATAGNQAVFSSMARFSASGHLLSLLKGDDFENMTNVNNCTFPRLFQDCTTLVSAEDLVIPSFTNSHTYFCYAMFMGCTALTTPPALPSTTLAGSCYYSLFNGCSSLTSAPSLPALTLKGSCYCAMFRGCTSLTTSPSLPATTLETNCYNSMFFGCTALTSSPTLPVTTLAEGCYNQMYRGCTSLTTAQPLPATTLANKCYRQMYVGCTSLTSAPVLSATTLTTECYYEMLYGCSSLAYVKCLATDISATDCTKNWLYNVSTTGVFVCDASTTWPRSSNGIPATWVKVDKRTMPSGYKQVLSISNPNHGYINTGFIFRPDLSSFEIGIKPVDDEYSFLITSNTSSSSNYGMMYCWTRYNGTYLLQAALGQSLSFPFVSGSHTLKYYYVDNTTTFTLEKDGSTKTYVNANLNKSNPHNDNVILLGRANATDSEKFKGEVYYFKYAINSDSCDYVPCVRESDNVAGFYDFVSQTFKTSANGNAFTAGQEI